MTPDIIGHNPENNRSHGNLSKGLYSGQSGEVSIISKSSKN